VNGVIGQTIVSLIDKWFHWLGAPKWSLSQKQQIN